VDELAAHLEQVRGRAKTAVDRRALDLLETEVQRRGAELKNQPGPHTEAALNALKRAFKYEWSDGEPRLMADLLAGLGTIRAQLQHPVHHQQDLWLRQQLDGVYVSALRGDGDVSLGKSQALYEALERDLRDALGTDDHDYRLALVSYLCQTYRAGVEKKLTG